MTGETSASQTVVSGWTLIKNPCYNVMAGAFVLRGCLDRHGESWEAIGCYNATSRNKRAAYSWKIYRELLKGATAQLRELDQAGTKEINRPRPPVSSLRVSVTDIQ